MKNESTSPANINRAESEALDSLSRDYTIMIRPADKGGAIVLMDYENYHNEILLQLSGAKVYERSVRSCDRSLSVVVKETLQKAT